MVVKTQLLKFTDTLPKVLMAAADLSRPDTTNSYVVPGAMAVEKVRNTLVRLGPRVTLEGLPKPVTR